MNGKSYTARVSFIAAAASLALSATLAPLALGAAGAADTGQASAARCAQVVLYDVRGSAQNTKSAWMGSVLSTVTTDLETGLAGVVTMRVVPVTYPAVSVLSGIDDRRFDGVQYTASRSRGVAQLKGLVRAQLAACPATRSVFVGYSQGADVVATYLTSGLPARTLEQVAAVALFGDPRFNPADTAIDAGNFGPKLPPIFGKFRVSGQRHLEGMRPRFPAALAARTISVCDKGDFICSYSWTNASACVGAHRWASFDASVLAGRVVPVPRVLGACAHLRYVQDYPSAIRPDHRVTTEGVANFLAAKIKSAWATSWGNAIDVPGAPSAEVTSVSCASAGNCVAGLDSGQVSDEVNGTWETAVELPGIAALSGGGSAVVTSVSCASAGNCAAGGYYNAESGGEPAGTDAFVASEVSGTWNAAIELPGTTSGQVTAVYCPSPGNCAAGLNDGQVANEVSGTWNAAIEIPGISALTSAASAQVTSMSCASPGNCLAGGVYRLSPLFTGDFVASEVNGTWNAATEVPGVPGQEPMGGAVTSTSCASTGYCAAGGFYLVPDSESSEGFGYEAFVVTEVNGTWNSPIQVPGLALPDAAEVASVSCPSAGNCVAGGTYSGSRTSDQAFVTGELDGTWHDAVAVPGTSAPDMVPGTSVRSVSCTSMGNCAVAGVSGTYQPFVASELNGTWHVAILIRGLTGYHAYDLAGVSSVSCAPSGGCAVGGYYSDADNNEHPFVASSG